MLYDAAWVYRTLAQDEVTEARDTLRKTLHDKLIQEAKAKLPSNAPVPNIPVPAIDLSQVPEQKSELNAVSTYKLLIDEFPEQALGVEARFELAELRAERAQHDDTIKLLKEALDVEPVDRPVPSETLERIRLRLGAALSAKKDHAAALIQFETVAGNPKSPHLAQALYRAGETLFAQGEYAPAVEKLKPFLEKNEFHSIGGISDRALLRLGFAQLAEKKPDLARKALETLLQRFGNGNPYAPEARYGIGLSFAAENRPDDALRAYEQVIASTRTDVAARAQLAIGLVRRMQGKHIQAAEAFMVVDKTYDYPEIGYSAELEAARSYRDAEQADKARPILEKLLKAVPAESTWAKAAQELLAMLAQK
jgi:tetratricopeptide (TPR) repeat protein